MKKIVKFIFLITVYLSFLIGIANAQKFWVKFIDSDESGTIDFTVTAYNYADQTYYTGVATIDHELYLEPLEIPAGGSSTDEGSWEVNPGGFLIYDIYLTPDPDSNIYYWTSKGDAVGSSTGYTLSIDWLNGESNIPVFTFAFSTTDTFQITAVPIPSALWLLGSGAITLGLIHKKLLTR